MEAMVVTGLVSVIFAILVSILINSDTYWKTGQDKILEYSEARRVIDTIVKVIRDSNPSWNVNGTCYNVSISDNNTRIDAYVPLYNDDNTVNSLQKVTYKLDPSNSRQLLFKRGTDAETVVSAMVSNIVFGGSCDCTSSDAMNCNSVNTSCPAVRVFVATVKHDVFNLTTDVTLRNRVNLTLSNSTGIEEPEEGEF